MLHVISSALKNLLRVLGEYRLVVCDKLLLSDRSPVRFRALAAGLSGLTATLRRGCDKAGVLGVSPDLILGRVIP